MAANPFNVDDRLGRVRFLGKSMRADLRAAVTDATLDSGTDRVSELTFILAAPGLDLLGEGLFRMRTAVDFEGLRLEVSVVETGEGPDGNGEVAVRCRAASVGRLKRRRGPKVMNGASPSEFVRAECKAAKANYLVQDSAPRKNVARDVPTATTSQETEAPSSWTTFQRLASELGFVCFEGDNVIYFGKPTWILSHAAQTVPVKWLTDYDDQRANRVPACRRTESQDSVTTVEVDLPLERAQYVRVGRKLVLSDMPGFNGEYMITGVTYPLLGNAGDVHVTAEEPSNPIPQPPGGLGGGGIGGGGTGGFGTGAGRTPHAGTFAGRHFTHEQLVNAFTIYQVGHRMKATFRDIVVAFATVQQESGMRNLNYGDRDSVGLFQQRPSQGWGTRAQCMDPEHAARKFFQTLFNVPRRSSLSVAQAAQAVQRSAYPSAYADDEASSRAILRAITRPPAGGGSGGGATGRRGSKLAADFAAFALAQVGDTYVYGGEVNLNDPNPDAFDCSELIEWAAHQAGVYIPDGSSAQYQFCRKIGFEQAVRTRGALLFAGPGGSQHAGISLGNGHTVEALNRSYGIAVMNARGRVSTRWSGFGLIPGMRYG